MDYLNEIKKLPEDIKDILISFFGAQINREIINNYNLSEQQASSFIDLVNEVYLKKINIDSLLSEISNRLSLDPKKANQVRIDILVKKLLIADDYFKGKISETLQKSGIDLNKISPIVAQELQAIEKEKEDREPDKKNLENGFQDVLLDSKDDKEFIEQSKEDTLTLFKEDLEKILNLDSKFNEIVSDYNDDLLEFLEDDIFISKLENVIFSNTEVITRIKPIIDNNTKSPTVANWLKDFIAFHGSGYFNSITLAEYLVNSSSAKRLSLSEKRIIKRLLNIYRNVFFFSKIKEESQDLEVIPLEYSDIEKEKLEDNKKVMTEEGEGGKKAGLDNMLTMKKNIEDEKFNAQKNSKSSKNTSLANELELMLKDYKPDTLEYRTISQEIKRLKAKNSEV